MAEIHLTPREEQVLRHVRSGESNKEIAIDLKIGEQAVKALVSRLLLKYGVPNRTSLAGVHLRQPVGPVRRELRDVLQESRRLREENRQLMSALRSGLRELRHLRVVRRERGGTERA